jgi:hypothetical protein
VLINNVVVDNAASSGGAGIYVQNGSPQLWQTTIARNGGAEGSGLFVTENGIAGSDVVLTNTILVSQAVGLIVTSGPTNTAMLRGVLWFGNGAQHSGAGLVSVTSPITANPLFQADGYHLSAGSPAIDAGIASGIANDIDGDLRRALPDLGADEFWRRLLLPTVIR